MAKLATRKEMHQDGWKDITINGVDCIEKTDPSCNYRIIAEWTEDGYTTQSALTKITEVLGEPYKMHNTWDSQGERIMSIEY